MKVFTAYTSGFSTIRKFPLTITLLYGFNLVISLLIIMPLARIFSEYSANSMAYETLLNKFDYTIVTDFLNNVEQSLPAIHSHIKVLVFLAFIAHQFLLGGVFQTLKNERFSGKDFFGSGAYYFFRNIRITFYMFILYATLAALIFIPTGLLFSHYSDAGNESASVISLICGVSLFFICLVPFLQISDYSRISLLINDSGVVLKDIGRGFSFVFKRFFSNYALFLLLLVMPILVLGVYWIFGKFIPAQSMFGISLMFCVQQLVIFVRNWFNLWRYESEFAYYSDAISYVRAKETAKVAAWEQTAINTEKLMIEKDKEEKQIKQTEEINQLVNDISQNISKAKSEISSVEEKLNDRQTVLKEITSTVISNEKKNIQATQTEQKTSETTSTQTTTTTVIAEPQGVLNTAENQFNENLDSYWEILEEENEKPKKEPEKQKEKPKDEDLLELDI